MELITLGLAVMALTFWVAFWAHAIVYWNWSIFISFPVMLGAPFVILGVIQLFI